MSAGLRFLPWVRRGLAPGAPSTTAGPLPARIRITAKVELGGDTTGEASMSVSLFGPGDVPALEGSQILRRFPAKDTDGAEPTGFAHVELDRLDLPWAFTPGPPDADGRLRPWLVLVVVPSADGELVKREGVDLEVLSCPVAALPNLVESWAWAHAQVAVTQENEDVATALSDEARTLSRLVAPRKLKADTRYIAALVPAFEAGRLTALGKPLDGHETAALQDAWTFGGTGSVDLPAFDGWRFRTGPEGDFETLVRRLRPRVLADTVGLRDMDISGPGPGLPNHPAGTPGTVLGLEGALRAPYTRPTVWAPAVRDAWRRDLRKLLTDTSTRLAPPLYGGVHADLDTVPGEADEPDWLRELNLDPRHRAAAGLGTRAVQAHQEELAAAAWAQAAALREANELLARAQLARAAGQAMWNRRLSPAGAGEPLGTAEIVALTRPVHEAVPVTPRSTRTIASAVQGNQGLLATTSAAFRRRVSPRGPLARRVLAADEMVLDAPVQALAAGTLTARPPIVIPAGGQTLTEVSTGAEPLDVRKITAALIRRAPAWWTPQPVPANLPLEERPSPVATSPGTVITTDRHFVGSADGRLFEHRFVNGDWMWRDHDAPPGGGIGGAITAGYSGRVFAPTRDGRLISRWWDGDRWQWADHDRPVGTFVADGGTMVGSSVFVTTTGGAVAELRHTGAGWSWIDHGQPSATIPPGIRLTSPAAGRTGAAMMGSKVFVSTRQGWLFERVRDAAGNWRWVFHGAPPGTAVIEGVGPSMLNSKLFVTARDGRLFERFYGTQGWQWVDHGRPPGGNAVSNPGAAMMDVKVFVRVSDGSLAERVWSPSSSSWVWVGHGKPGATLIGDPDAAVGDHTVFVTTTDGRQFARRWENGWTWRDYGTTRDSGGQGGPGQQPPSDTRWAPRLGLLSSLLVAHLDNPAGNNRIYHRAAHDLDLEGVPRRGWDASPAAGPALGPEGRGLGFAVADVSGSGRPDLVALAVEPAAGRCEARYWIGPDVDANGRPTGPWSGPKPLHAPLNADVQGADLAIADLDGDGKLDLIFAYVTGGPGTHRIFYRIGWALNRQGDVTQGWSESKEVPWQPGTVHGLGVEVADLDDDDRADIAVLVVEEQGGADVARYMIGHRLNRRGNVVGGWTGTIPVGGGPIAPRHQGAGLAVADFTGTRLPDLVVLLIADGPTDNQGRVRIGFDLAKDGTAQRWSADQVVPGWFGWENQGAAIAVADVDPALVTRREQMGNRFIEASQRHQTYLAPAQALARAAAPPPVDLAQTAGRLTAALEPRHTVTAKALARVKVAGRTIPVEGVGGGHGAAAGADPLRELLRSVSFPQPTYELLRELSQDHVLPGVEQVPPETMTVLRANPAFIESFLAGLNTELSRELLWREFPGDPRTTWFRQFWDVRNAASAGQPLTDIPPLTEWGSEPLGGHTTGVGAAREDALVLLVRGEVLRRYPSASVSARRARWKTQPGGARDLDTEERLPTFSGWMTPDLLFFGFPLTVSEARGTSTDPGWFFVLREQPAAPRFGVDDPPDPRVDPPKSWSDLDWRHLVPTGNLADVRFLPLVPPTSLPRQLDGATYGRNGADMARILLQQSVQVAVHASRMIPPVDEGWHVKQVRTRDAADPSDRIRALRGEHVDGRTWELPVEAVVEAIEHGEHFFVQRDSGPAARLLVVHRADGRRHVRTTADTDVPNNLLELPEAPAR